MEVFMDNKKNNNSKQNNRSKNNNVVKINTDFESKNFIYSKKLK